FTDPEPPSLYSLSLHDALPILERADQTARILDVTLQSITEDASEDVELACAGVYEIFGITDDASADLSVQGVIDRLVTDRQNPSDRKSTRLNSSHVSISYAVFC